MDESKSIGGKPEPGLPGSSRPRRVNRAHSEGSQEFSLRLCLVDRVHEEPKQEMATRFLLFINVGPLVDHGEFISAGKSFLGVTITLIFLLRSTSCSSHFRLIFIPTFLAL